MKLGSCLPAIALGALCLGSSADAQVSIPSIELVMTGPSTSGNDQVWMRISGQPSGVPADCVYGSWSLFYSDGTLGIDKAKAYALLLTAKATGRPVYVLFSVQATVSDFGGFGTSNCLLSKVALQ